MENLTYAEARTRTHKAREHLSKVQKEDGENRIKWLEGIAHSNFLENPKGTFDSFLKQMISAAKQMQLNRKLKRILKPEYRPLTYIEVPDKKWFHSAEDDEIYSFEEGLF